MVRIDRGLGCWLAVVAVMMFAMIVLGGLTRLSGSGLSMVHWKPVSGIIPPLTQEEWEAEFSNYRKTPEYLHKNSHLTLEGFKSIFYVEYLHRLLGRLIGVVYILPWLFFGYRGRLRGAKFWKFGAIGLLGGMQGILGWYMVKSGLVDKPWVSHYRLAAHLTLGVTLYGLVVFQMLVYLGLSRPWRWISWPSALLAAIFWQIVSGGLVAGLHAGSAFRTLVHAFSLEILWIETLGLENLFSNPLTVLSLHILWAAIIFVAALFWSLAAKTARGRHLLPILLAVQIALGFLTAYGYGARAPVAWGSLHQAFAIGIFTCMLWFCARQGSNAAGNSPKP